MRIFKLFYAAFAIPKMYNLENRNPYLDQLEKANPNKENYLDRLRPRSKSRVPLTIQLPIMIRNSTLSEPFSGSWFFLQLLTQLLQMQMLELVDSL